ncbi:MAG: hypothetical protein GY765_06335 [bacterium]|nr:hypothetical protein [bacterium]
MNTTQKKLAILLLVLVIAVAIDCVAAKRETLIINEIAPSTPPGRVHSWLELYNRTSKEIDAAGFRIDYNRREVYRIPASFPPVPPNSFIVIKFDNQGPQSDHCIFSNGKAAILHTHSESTTTLDRKCGEVAVYKKDAPDDASPECIVRWGLPDMDTNKNEKILQLLRESKWTDYVCTIVNSGIYEPGTPLEDGCIIGLFPGSITTHKCDYSIYSKQQKSPGNKNFIPQVSGITPSDGAEVKQGSVVIDWEENQKYPSYEIEIDELSDPAPPKRISLNTSFFNPDLQPGIYQYKIRNVDGSDSKQQWTSSRRIIVKDIVWDSDIDHNPKILPIAHQHQRKDTHLLCFECYVEGSPWDRSHLNEPPIRLHGKHNCARASISMLSSYYGKSVSQDRIAFYESHPGGTELPTLCHNMTSSISDISKASNWVLALTNGDRDYMRSQRAIMRELGSRIKANRPILARGKGHMYVINGYGIDVKSKKWFYVQDPITGSNWISSEELKKRIKEIWVFPRKNGRNSRGDEDSLKGDIDEDGIRDFDEDIRFKKFPGASNPNLKNIIQECIEENKKKEGKDFRDAVNKCILKKLENDSTTPTRESGETVTNTETTPPIENQGES